MSEHASADDSQAYRRSVAAFAALGYAWVLGCLALAIGLIAWVLPQLLQGSFEISLGLTLFAAFGLLWTSLRALWMRFEDPEGIALTADKAPALFEALERIRRKVKGPPIHAVYLDAEFNASIRQTPRWGLFGGTVNTLSIGLPLVMALDRIRLLAVLTHEYGHLRGDHGRFAAWIYRTRLAWLRLRQGLRDDDSLMALLTSGFLNWYSPRFAARSFALARQDEYEADRIAGRLLGKEVAAEALIEIEVKGAWLAQNFWAQHWRAAAAQALPLGPYQAMRQQFAQAPESGFAAEALRQALARLSGLDDTHPGLRDRLAALGAKPALPDWSRRGALHLLGDQAEQGIAHFDRQWCRDNASDWKLHHAWLARVRERVHALAAGRATSNAKELVEEARLRRLLDPNDELAPLYELALQRSTEHPEALSGLARTQTDRAARLQTLQRLWDASSAHRWWAARDAVAELETPRAGLDQDTAALKLWRERLKTAAEGEDRAWEELQEQPYFQRIGRHDLNDFELGELRLELARCKPLQRCWLVCKHLREFPQRRAYLVFVELPGMDDEDRYGLCRSLERSLSLPGPALVLWAGESPTLEEITRSAFEPVHRV